MESSAPAERLKIAAMLGCVYLFWGSAFVALRYVVQAVHPALVAGMRYVIAGSVLMLTLAIRGQSVRVSARDAAKLTLLGLIMFTCNTMLLSYGGRAVTAGMAALIISTIPIFIGFIEAMLPGGNTLRWPTVGGLLLGSTGVVVLLGLTRHAPMSPAVKMAVLALLVAALAWSVGTVMLRRMRFSAAPLVCVAWQMLLGGSVDVAIGLGDGGLGTSSFHADTLGTILYLSFFGTLAGYTSYAYLLRHVSTSIATTYAYVNPIVAVMLGWALLNEKPLSHEWAGMAIILLAVVLILFRPPQKVKAIVSPALEKIVACPRPVTPTMTERT